MLFSMFNSASYVNCISFWTNATRKEAKGKHRKWLIKRGGTYQSSHSKRCSAYLTTVRISKTGKNTVRLSILLSEVGNAARAKFKN